MTRRLIPLLATLLVAAAAAAGNDRAADDQYFDADGVRIRYIEKGEGEPVVLIHGFSRTIELSWIDTGVLAALATNYRVIALDCRGHGKSDKPHGDGAYGMTMVDDVAALLDHLDIEQAHIVGYSMGGRIGLRFAASHSNRVMSVTLIGAGGARKSDHHRLWDEVARSLEQGDGIRPLIEHIWPADAPRPSEEEIAGINAMTLAANDATALASVARGYRAFATSDDEVAALSIPVLAIIGTGDAFRSDVRVLREQKPDVRLVELEGENHLTVLSLPRTHEAMVDFLTAARRPSQATP